MGKLLLYIILLLQIPAQSQVEQHVLYSKAIENNIKEYTLKSKRAYLEKDYKYAGFLLDSFIGHVINGSYLDNFNIKRTSGKNFQIYQSNKPIVLFSYASWCTPGVGEIPALNEIAENYSDKIDFIVLYWDSKRAARKSSQKYSNKIMIVYVDEKENKNDHIIKVLKHSIGFPTAFFIDADKKIIDVRRGAIHSYNKSYNYSYDLNYNSFINGISLFNKFIHQKNTRVTVK